VTTHPDTAPKREAPQSTRHRRAVLMLRMIVLSTMANPPRWFVRRSDHQYQLPDHVVEMCQDILDSYGCRITPQAPPTEQAERDALDSAISDLVGLTS